MMRPRIGDVVEVQWNDTCTRHGWTHEKETAEFANPIVCVSWGRLLARDKDVVLSISRQGLEWAHKDTRRAHQGPPTARPQGFASSLHGILLRLASSYAAELGDYNRFEAIPAGCVKKISVLKRYED